MRRSHMGGFRSLVLGRVKRQFVCCRTALAELPANGHKSESLSQTCCSQTNFMVAASQAIGATTHPRCVEPHPLELT
jgi:hypothetical protein